MGQPPLEKSEGAVGETPRHPALGRSSRLATWSRWTWRSHVILGAGAVLTMGLGFVFASFPLLGLARWVLILAAAAYALGLVILNIAAERRSPSWIPLSLRLLCAAVCWFGLAAAAYLVFWVPFRTVNDGREFPGSGTPADIRRTCHRSLLWFWDPHDELIWMMRNGDETSIPYIIWALRWMPKGDKDDEGIACTWGHGIEALETITNNSPGQTRKDWTRWYAANKRRTTLEWWADGFTAEGFAVSSAGDEASIRKLLSVLGRREWCQYERTTWLSTNAIRMLHRLDEVRVRSVMTAVRMSGSVPERRGLARYAGEFPRDKAEPVLSTLMADEDRSVRLWASGVLCKCRLKWLKNPQRLAVEQYEAGAVNPDAFFAPDGKNVVAAVKGNQLGWARSEVLRREIDVAPDEPHAGDPARPKCIIRIENESTEYRAPAVVSIEGRAGPSGAVLYSRPLITSTRRDVDELRWLFDKGAGRLYISIPGFTCLIEAATGRVIWEMGFGTGNADDLFLLGDYLVIRPCGDLVVCDAARGGILANFSLAEGLFDDRFSLVDGRLRVADTDGRLFITDMPKLRRADGE